jgi:RNA polymerase sigma-70 factor (ECF subfamily)
MKRTDAALVENCLAGQKTAFAELIRRHQNSIFHLALRITCDRDEAADLAQEAFIRAYRKLRLYDPGYSFKNWLFSICANLAKNRFRASERRRKAERTHLELSYKNDNPGALTRLNLDEALANIPEKLRIPLVLKHKEGFSYEEIAQILNIGVSAAKMRVKRGRDELVNLLRPARGDLKK